MNEKKDKLLPLYSFNGEHLGTISLVQAYAAAENNEATLSWKGRGRKARVTAVHLQQPRKQCYRSATTLTAWDVENNAFVQAFANKAHLPLSAKDSMRALDEAENKVKAWPEVHDDRAVIVCAGTVHGATVTSQLK